MSEKTFFLNATRGHMTLGDIFSDVARHHTPDEVARVFIAGTSLTTPSEAEMLAGWQKPFLFARFFLAAVVTLLVAMVLPLLDCYRGYDVVLVGLTMVVPITILLMTWEMNIPRSISLAEVLGIVAVGGAFSLVFTIVFNMLNPLQGAQWAPVTEEPAKLLIILILLRKKNYKYVTEGILLGMAVGTGFAVMETLSYVMDSLRASMVFASVNNLDLVFAMLADGFSYYDIGMVLFDADAASVGLSTGLLRAVNAVAGHGMLAAFYGGGVMLSKGSEPFRMTHLLSGKFLKYFIISFSLHFLNNLDLTSEVFPMVGPVWSYSIVQTVVSVALFLPLLRQGVDQVVAATLLHHSGQLTMAVEQLDINMEKYTRPQRPAVVRWPIPEPQRQYPQAQTAANAGIQFLSGPNAGRGFRLIPGKPVSLGRTPGQCGLAMPSCSRVSSRHCSLELRGRAVVITDLSSTNGTFADGQRLQPNIPTPVANGTIVCLANQNCAFRVVVE